MNLRRRTIDEIALSVDYGVTASANAVDVGPQFLRITDIQDDRVDWRSVPFCETSPTEEKSAQLAPGDIVFARTGATTGKSFLIRTCPPRAVFASYLIRVRPNQSIVDPRYLAWFFQTPDYWRQVTTNASGTAQPGVNASKLRALTVPVQPLEEQRRIADILDKADAIRRKRKEAIALTEELLRSAFLEMFGDPVTNPKGWPVARLGELTEQMKYGTSQKCDGFDQSGIAVLRIPNVVGGVINWTDLKFVHLCDEEAASLRLRRGDLLFVRSNGNPAYIARCAVFDEDRTALFASYLIRVRLVQVHVLPSYIRAAFSADSYRARFASEAQTTAGNYNINTEELRRLVVALPPLELQRCYADLERTTRVSSARMANATVHADTLFEALVHRAFRGQLVAPNGVTKTQLALFDRAGELS